MVNEGFQLIDLAGGEHRQPFQLVIQLQGKGGGKIVPLRQVTDQSTVRLIHEEGADDDAAQQFSAVDQGEGNVVQVCLAGKNIGLSQLLGGLSRLHMQPETLPFLKDLLLQKGAVGSGLTEGHNEVSLAVYQLNGKAGKFLEIPQHCGYPALRHKGKNAHGHNYHPKKRQNSERNKQYNFPCFYYTTFKDKKQLGGTKNGFA